MEFKELKKKSEAELHKVLADYRTKLRELRFKDANKQLKNVREIRAVRTVIAQAITLLNELKNQNTKNEKPEKLKPEVNDKKVDDKK